MSQRNCMKTINDPKVATSWCLALMTLLLSDLFWGLPACAQIVNDGATATLNHITNTISGSIIVGTNGPFTLLILTNGTLLTNSGTGTIGLNAGASSNTVKVTSANTRWLMSSDLSVGNVGSFNHLVITNGGLVQNGFGALGINPSSASNVFVGFNGTSSNNLLQVSGGAQLTNHGNSVLGLNTGANGNIAVVFGSNSLWGMSQPLFVGSNGAMNRLVISNGAQVFSLAANVGTTLGSSSNSALVTGAGSAWRMPSADFDLGYSGTGNLLVISNGGLLIT